MWLSRHVSRLRETANRHPLELHWTVYFSHETSFQTSTDIIVHVYHDQDYYHTRTGTVVPISYELFDNNGHARTTLPQTLININFHSSTLPSPS
jgi:hypothetical protein